MITTMTILTVDDTVIIDSIIIIMIIIGKLDVWQRAVLYPLDQVWNGRGPVACPLFRPESGAIWL